MWELYAAAAKGDAAAVRCLLESGRYTGRVDQQWGPSGLTALHTAARKGHTVVVQLLLEAGADVDQANEPGWTPLYSACTKGHFDVAVVLLLAGADVSLSCKGGKTPLQAAISHHAPGTVVQLLEQHAERMGLAQGAEQLSVCN